MLTCCEVQDWNEFPSQSRARTADRSEEYGNRSSGFSIICVTTGVARGCLKDIVAMVVEVEVKVLPVRTSGG